MSVHQDTPIGRIIFQQYINTGLISLLRQIRGKDRYPGKEGVNILSNAVSFEEFDHQAVYEEMIRAKQAGQRRLSFQSSLEQGQQGISFGLNPYTDWTLSCLDGKPDHWYMFLGTDWSSVASPIKGDIADWFKYAGNPFFVTNENYWNNLWGWIMGRYPKNPEMGNLRGKNPTEEEVASFIKEDGGGFIFHNFIPYLRPADVGDVGSKWFDSQWKAEIKRDAIDDLRLIRQIAEGRIIVHCTRGEFIEDLLEAGFPKDSVVCWNEHPSHFNTTKFRNTGTWFRGRDYFIH